MPRPQLNNTGDADNAQSLHLLVDSTGLKLCGAGEWLVERHGTRRRRAWRKLHLGVDAGTGQIVAAAWQKASGYNKRVKVEASIGRWKQMIGDGLRSRIDERRVTEVNLAVDVLNRMQELGRPSYVRSI